MSVALNWSFISGRGYIVPWEKKVEDLKQEAARSRPARKQKITIPTFFEFVDEEIKKNYHRHHGGAC